MIFGSLPSWECGLKFSSQSDVFQRDRVAPFVGVWIEIVYDLEDVEEVSVAPFVGVWIEIYTEREGDRKRSVAPFVGVWIEIRKALSKLQEKMRRSLRGSVD